MISCNTKMKRIIYSKKADKFIILMIFVALIVNLIPFVSCELIMSEQDFYRKNIKVLLFFSDTVTYNPETEEPQEGWDLDTYKLTDKTKNLLMNAYVTPDVSYLQDEVEEAINKYNENLEKFHKEGKTLKEAAQTAAKIAIGKYSEGQKESYYDPERDNGTSGTGGNTSGGTSGTGGTTSGGTGGTGGGPIELPILSDFRPAISAGGAVDIIGAILSVLMTLGVVMVVVAIALIGFNSILGSASEKAEYQQKLAGVIFAGIFMVASSSIAKLIMSVAATF